MSSSSELRTFPGGVHPPDEKTRTAEKVIEMVEPPALVGIALSQHIGAPARAVVKVGDEVRLGQTIGEAGGFVSAPVHASVSGKVKSLGETVHPLGHKVGCVVIENDGRDAWADGMNEPGDYTALTSDEIKKRLLMAGLVGMGGATFPTHVKLSPPADKKIDAIIGNGVECEPFLTADHRLMLEKPEGIVEGIRILKKLLGANRAIIGIEANKPDAAEKIREAAGPDVEVELLQLKYPQGAEKQLIKALLGREVPSGGLPMDVGAVVQNVGTLLAAYEAVYLNKPLIERVVTVSGDAVGEPGNFLVRIGHPIADLVRRCEPSGAFRKLISGGPMMGLAQVSLDGYIQKGTSGLLLFGDAAAYDVRPCIRCGRCVKACPARLVPSEFSTTVEAGAFTDVEALDILDCIECGACTFICPSKRPIVQQIKLGKAHLRAIKQRAKEKRGA